MRIKLALTILFFIVLSISGYAQYTSNVGRFEVDFIKGCAPLTVNINNLQPADCPCDVRFGDGTTGQDVFSHTYVTPGTYTLEIDYQTLIPRTDFITIEVVDNVPPAFDILTCSNFEATINVTDSNYDQYSIDFDNDGTFETTINQGNPVIPHTYPGAGNYDIAVKGVNLIAADNCNSNVQTITALNTLPAPDITSITVIDQNTIDIGYSPQPNIVNRLEIATNGSATFQLLTTLDNTQNQFTLNNSSIDNLNDYYCFRLGSYDACNNSSTYSPTICTVNLDASFQDGQNVLSWSPGGLATDYTICTNGNCNLVTLVTNYTDIDATCNQDYCYRIQANYPNGAISTSLEECGTSFSTATPDVVSDLVMERDLGQINISWPDPTNFTPDTYSLRRSYNSEAELLQDITSPYLDIINDDLGRYCYQLSYVDECGNISPETLEVCSLLLRGILQNDNTVEISWNPYRGYQQGIQHYRVEKYDVDGFLRDTFITTSTSITDGNDITVFQISRYKVFAVPVDASLEESYSNEIKITKRNTITHPKAFTPNGDGLNDEYRVYGTYIRSFRMKIFNRWGELLFTTNDISIGWDGTYNGQPLPSGTFTYSTEIVDLANRTWALSGFFSLIRN